MNPIAQLLLMYVSRERTQPFMSVAAMFERHLSIKHFTLKDAGSFFTMEDQQRGRHSLFKALRSDGNTSRRDLTLFLFYRGDVAVKTA